MAAVGEKRALEEAETALAVEEQPDAKIAKVEGSEEPATVSGSEAAEDAGDAPAADESKVTIGYKAMSGAQAQAYFQDLLSNLRRSQSLNEYEHHMVCELVKLGHPDAERKLAGGVRAVQVRDTQHEGATSKCFFLIHEDGKVEDVSYRKCIFKLFPGMEESVTQRDAKKASTRAASTPAKGRSRGGGMRGRGRKTR